MCQRYSKQTVPPKSKEVVVARNRKAEQIRPDGGDTLFNGILRHLANSLLILLFRMVAQGIPVNFSSRSKRYHWNRHDTRRDHIGR